MLKIQEYFWTTSQKSLLILSWFWELLIPQQETNSDWQQAFELTMSFKTLFMVGFPDFEV